MEARISVIDSEMSQCESGASILIIYAGWSTSVMADLFPSWEELSRSVSMADITGTLRSEGRGPCIYWSDKLMLIEPNV